MSHNAREYWLKTTNNTMDIATVARSALENCYQKGYGLMKGGIMLYDLTEEGTR